MLNVNKRHVKECELPVAFLSIPIQVLHFTSSLYRDGFRVACEGKAPKQGCSQPIMLDKTCSLASNGYHPKWCSGARTGRLCMAGVAVSGMHSLWERTYMRKRGRERRKERERERRGRGVSFNTSVKIPAFTSSPQSFPPGPIQVPLGISPLGVRTAVQWTGLIPHSLLPHTHARTQHIEKDPKSAPATG